MISFGSPTPYSSLPAMPTINALPGGIPAGPWAALYRAAPGAQIPATRYPGMMGARSAGGVTLLGPLGQTSTTAGAMGQLLVGGAIAAGAAALLAFAIKSKHPIRNAALVGGGLSIGGTLLAIGLNKAAEPAEPAV